MENDQSISIKLNKKTPEFLGKLYNYIIEKYNCNHIELFFSKEIYKELSLDFTEIFKSYNYEENKTIDPRSIIKTINCNENEFMDMLKDEGEFVESLIDTMLKIDEESKEEIKMNCYIKDFNIEDCKLIQDLPIKYLKIYCKDDLILSSYDKQSDIIISNIMNEDVCYIKNMKIIYS